MIALLNLSCACVVLPASLGMVSGIVAVAVILLTELQGHRYY